MAQTRADGHREEAVTTAGWSRRSRAATAMLWSPAGVFFVILFLSFLRWPQTILTPDLFGEDGSHVFAYYFNDRDPRTILKSYRGAILLIPNLVGYLAVGLPTRCVPYALSAVPLVVSCIAFATFSAATFRSIVPSDRARAIFCVVTALLPLHTWYLSTVSVNIAWNLMWILALASLTPFPDRLGWALARFALLAPLTWSHPLAVMMIPVFLFQAVRLPSVYSKAGYAGLLALTLCYAVFGVETQRVSAVTPIHDAGMIALTLLEGVAYASAFGPVSREFWYARGMGGVPAILGGGVLLALGLWLYRTHRRGQSLPYPFLGCAMYLMLACVAPYVLSGRFHEEVFVFGPGPGSRYLFVSRLLLALLVLYALERNGLPGKWSPRGRVCAAGALALAVALWHVGRRPYWSKERTEGAVAVRAFVARVYAREQQFHSREYIRMRLDRGPWFSIEINTSEVPAPAAPGIREE